MKQTRSIAAPIAKGKRLRALSLHRNDVVDRQLTGAINPASDIRHDFLLLSSDSYDKL